MRYNFFDLDGTLIPVDSSQLWAQKLLAEVPEPERSGLAAKRLHYDEEYRRGTLNIDEFEDFEMRLLASFPRKRLDELREEYVRCDIAPHILPIAVKTVENCRRLGDKVVLVTASYRYAVEPIAGLFGISEILCAEPEEKESGEFTGRCLAQNFQEQKIASVLKFLGKEGKDARSLEYSSFYSDSRNDLPLLEFVASCGGEAVAVSPDDYLRQKAKVRGWKILEFFP